MVRQGHMHMVMVYRRPGQEPGTPSPWRLDVIGRVNGADGTSIALLTRHCPTQTECGLAEVPREGCRWMGGAPTWPTEEQAEERHTAPSFLEPGVCCLALARADAASSAAK